MFDRCRAGRQGADYRVAGRPCGLHSQAASAFPFLADFSAGRSNLLSSSLMRHSSLLKGPLLVSPTLMTAGFTYFLCRLLRCCLTNLCTRPRRCWTVPACAPRDQGVPAVKAMCRPLGRWPMIFALGLRLRWVKVRAAGDGGVCGPAVLDVRLLVVLVIIQIIVLCKSVSMELL